MIQVLETFMTYYYYYYYIITIIFIIIDKYFKP